MRLSKKIVIANETEAQSYNVANCYDDYFKEYNYQLEFLGVPLGSNLPNSSKIIESLEGTFATRIGAKIIQISAFIDLNGYPLISREIRLTANRFKRGMEDPELTIYLITEKLELLESFGNTLVFRAPSQESTPEILTIMLNETMTIYSYDSAG